MESTLQETFNGVFGSFLRPILRKFVETNFLYFDTPEVLRAGTVLQSRLKKTKIKFKFLINNDVSKISETLHYLISFGGTKTVRFSSFMHRNILLTGHILKPYGIIWIQL